MMQIVRHNHHRVLVLVLSSTCSEQPDCNVCSVGRLNFVLSFGGKIIYKIHLNDYFVSISSHCHILQQRLLPGLS